ncbi:MAG: glycosyltransferase [Solirubrobacterales bacterium]|nr:glycosyltransferase [Solirubrobacterales bacterium]
MSWHTSPLAAPGSGDAGGMNVYVREIARALGDAGARVDILTARPDVVVPLVTALHERVRVLTLPRDGGLEVALPRYDVVHSHYWQSAAPGHVLAERSGARHVHTFHTSGHAKNASLAPEDVAEPDRRLRTEREIVRDVDAVIVSTEDERAQTVSRLQAEPGRVHVIPPGVDTRRFTPRDAFPARAALGLRDHRVVVHVGRIQPLKGIATGIRALAQLGGELPRRCALVVAGGPSGPRGRRTLATLRDEAHRLPDGIEVRFVGRCAHRALPVLLGAADAAVVCSRSESFCLAALEAIACGLPIVGTAVGGLPSFVAEGESGYLVPGRAEAFAPRLLDVLTSPRRRAMAAAATESARRFSWPRTARRILEAYDI